MKTTKRVKVVTGLLVIALIATVSIAAITFTPTQLDDRAQIEDLLITYARSMDNLDKDTWASCFSEDLINYHVDKLTVFGATETQLDMLSAPDDNGVTFMLWMLSGPTKSCLFCPFVPTLAAYRASFAAMTPKERLVEMGDMMVFERIDFGQSQLSNIVVDLDYGDVDDAKAYDYFRHWEDINPLHLANIGQLMNDLNWYFNEGTHEYTLQKESGVWKIIDFQGMLLRSEHRLKQL